MARRCGSASAKSDFKISCSRPVGGRDSTYSATISAFSRRAMRQPRRALAHLDPHRGAAFDAARTIGAFMSVVASSVQTYPAGSTR